MFLVLGKLEFVYVCECVFMFMNNNYIIIATTFHIKRYNSYLSRVGRGWHRGHLITTRIFFSRRRAQFTEFNFTKFDCMPVEGRPLGKQQFYSH